MGLFVSRARWGQGGGTDNGLLSLGARGGIGWATLRPSCMRGHRFSLGPLCHLQLNPLLQASSHNLVYTCLAGR